VSFFLNYKGLNVLQLPTQYPMRKNLGLMTLGLRQVTLANNQKKVCKLTGPVEVHWKDRITTCDALAIPGDGEILLGTIPLEGMDLMVNPVAQKLVGVHGDEILAYAK
jgi:hypothetical protein